MPGMQAVQNILQLVDGLYLTTGLAAELEELSFAHRAKQYGIPVPKISAIVHNKYAHLHTPLPAAAEFKALDLKNLICFSF